ncbi:MAG: hypothetical protein JJLCMIEE_02199 [Acidimicrobiales bacterium]|nr:MAG: isoprenylcysteine carboxylmethyltransferase family protein [Actinomycetota bacterium]MBV6509131.1 hypothetical protein [Acidimicrobiales bacterium]RIK08518.1 MAG: S-isoprenylcysteine methyltransferase [Acidobacteriota bacterium]
MEHQDRAGRSAQASTPRSTRLSRTLSLVRPGEWVTVQIALLVAIVVIDGGPRFPVRAWSATLGVTMLAVGLSTAIAAGLCLGAAFTPSPMPNASGRLVTGGPYRRVRHPVYGGVILAYLGFVLCTGVWWRLTLWSVLVAFYELKTRYEEARLEEIHPEYRAYIERTGRLLPALAGGKPQIDDPRDGPACGPVFPK